MRFSYIYGGRRWLSILNKNKSFIIYNALAITDILFNYKTENKIVLLSNIKDDGKTSSEFCLRSQSSGSSSTRLSELWINSFGINCLGISNFEIESFGINSLRKKNFRMSSFEMSGLRMSRFRLSGFRISGLEKSGLGEINSIWHHDGCL